jgi:protein TonB
VRAHAAAATPPAPTPVQPPPPSDQPPPPAGDTAGPPVFGVSMESTSTAGGGPAMRVGGGAGRGPGGPGEGDGDGERRRGAGDAITPVPAYEVTTMPLPQGRCAGRYTEEAKQAAVEGTVVLDLIVDDTGRARDVHVVSGLGHGLTEAAIAALKACHFSPGEKDGKPVPVRVRGFKIRFILQDAD